ncbi:GyrI-like domain-containing protein [Lederbergia sp. NSJ-179]|uniref:GyrI-like domain-containing protein n=1 Tax=Lederbergia sp. NSJ-179 TaxID=2931402 RepID=UPI001FD13E45|nr:GyrI-like domain-containing protein [Lederbergia sp. NSJ-179]MCJ7841416.1 GyrI-like domain-containing protein [Lederbergia sp. NSJ-179]
MQEPIIKKRAAFKVMGISVETTNENEMTAQAKIPLLWDRFYQEGISKQIPNPLDGHTVYGVYSDYATDVDGAYQMTIGLEVGNDSQSNEFVVKTIPASQYLVFTSEQGPLSKIVVVLWQDIWKYCEEANIKRSYTGDFEEYGERCADPENAQVEIYIAIE